MLWGERRGNRTIVAATKRWSSPMPQLNDLSKSLVALEQDATLIAVIEMGQSSWLVAGIVPGVERQPLKKLTTDQDALLQLLHRWRKEANEAGHVIKRITVAYEAGRDGFWLARWLRAHEIEAYVIHPSSIPVSREHRRAKTDRLDTELLKRAFLGWLRGEPKHCSMAAVPTIADEDARRPSRERENLVKEVTRLANRTKANLARLGIRGFRLRFVKQQIKQIEAARVQRLESEPGERRHAMVYLLARVVGIGVESADMLVQEVFSRKLRDRRAVARYAGLTGAPDESGNKRRERGLAKAGNARVRRGMIQLAWTHLLHQKDSVLAQWYRARTADARGRTRKIMIIALARKLLIALWRLVTTGEAPAGLLIRPAA